MVLLSYNSRYNLEFQFRNQAFKLAEKFHAKRVLDHPLETSFVAGKISRMENYVGCAKQPLFKLLDPAMRKIMVVVLLHNDPAQCENRVLVVDFGETVIAGFIDKKNLSHLYRPALFHDDAEEFLFAGAQQVFAGLRQIQFFFDVGDALAVDFDASLLD
jgi:hypothetical protein